MSPSKHNPAKPTKVWLRSGLARCRSQVEAQWGVYLDRCADVHRVIHEPEDWQVDGAWLPDYSIHTSRGTYLAEVKYEPRWGAAQWEAAKHVMLKADGVMVSGLFLLTDGGHIYHYSRNKGRDGPGRATPTAPGGRTF